MGEGDSDELMIALAALLEQVGDLDSLLRTSTRGTSAELEELRGVVVELATRVEKIDPPAALAAPAPPEDQPTPAAWVDTATAEDWTKLDKWVTWLNATYDLPRDLQVRACWPAHRGVAEELAALRSAWQAAALAARAPEPGNALTVWHERHLHPCLERLARRYATKQCTDGHRPVPPLQPTDDALLERARASAVRADQHAEAPPHNDASEQEPS